MQRHALSFPADTSPGSYWVQMGVYWLDTGERWPVQDEHASGDRLLLAPA